LKRVNLAEGDFHLFPFTKAKYGFDTIFTGSYF